MTIINRDFPQVLQSMLADYFSGQDLSSLRVGGTTLSFFESVAQAVSRTNADFFNLLVSLDVNSAFGAALDRLATQEGLTRRSASSSNGRIVVSDSSFNKVSGNLISGANYAAGATLLKLRGTGFPSSGSVYVGSGEKKEGPLLYSSASESGGFTDITLVSGLSKDHAPSEAVVLSQGGRRVVPIGTIVSTVSPSAVGGINFALQESAILEDGETQSQPTLVLSQAAGANTNIAPNSLSFFSVAPFTGASCNNPSAFTNGQDQESDVELRSRIQKARFSKIKGTSTAIESALVGATDGSDVIQSLSMQKDGARFRVFIDNGNTLEPSFAGISSEVLCPSASGGERFFSLSNTPVSTAYLVSQSSAPFFLSDGDTLSFLINNETAVEVVFRKEDFVNINQASATEVSTAINKTLLQARTMEGLSRVMVQSSGNELVCVGGTAQTALSFSSLVSRTVWLYKNDRLLNQDGKLAYVNSAPKAAWPALAASETLIVSVDGTPSATYTFQTSDFTNAGFGGVGVPSATLNQWIAVINQKIAGVTASSVDEKTITLASNLGANSRARVLISGGSLATKGVFPTEDSVGSDSDFVLDSYLGQLSLASPLQEGDVLAVSSLYTVAHDDSVPFSAVTFGSDAKLFVVVDGDCDYIENGLSAGSVLTVSSLSWDQQGRIVNAQNTGSFSLVESGDWMVGYDGSLPAEAAGVHSIVTATDDAVTFKVKGLDHAHIDGSAVLLADGTFLIAGGEIGTCEIYSPTTKKSVSTGAMLTPRKDFAMVVLSDGKVLAIGGIDLSGNALASCEIFDPSTGIWSSSSSLPVALAGTKAVVANTSNVLVFGGYNNVSSALSSVYKANYTTSLSSWNSATSMTVSRRRHTVTLLNDGNTAVIVGGDNGVSTVNTNSEEYNCSAETTAGTVATGHGFTLHGAVLTSDNKVFVAGGSSDISTAQSNTSLYDPSLNTWTAGTALPSARKPAYAARVSSTIMVVGGNAAPCTYAGTGTGSPTAIASPLGGNLVQSGCFVASSTAFYIFGGKRGVSSLSIPAIDTYTSSWIDNFSGSGAFTLTQGGVDFARTESVVQQIEVAAATNLTPSVLAEELDVEIIGGSAEAINKRLRLSSNRLDGDGRFMVVGVNEPALSLGFDLGSPQQSTQAHSGFVLSAGELGTPAFQKSEIVSAGSSQLSVLGDFPEPNLCVIGVRRTEASANSLVGNARNASRPVKSANQQTTYVDLELRSSLPQSALVGDHTFLANAFSISPEDSVTINVDNDANKTLNIPLSRRLTPTSVIYGNTNEFFDGDNNDEPLAALWGLNHSFLDHVVFMRARGKALGSVAAKSVLWRSKRFGKEGEASMRYVYPASASSSPSFSVDVFNSQIDISLGSGTARTNGTLRASTSIGYSRQVAPDERTMVTICCGMSVSSATRAASTVTLTLTLPSGLYSVTDHGIAIGQKVFLNSTDLVNFPSGVKTVTAVTATTISYTEAGTATTTPSLGTISLDNVGESLFGPVVVGDIVSLGSGVPTSYVGCVFRVTHKANQFVQGYASEIISGGYSTTLSWSPLDSLSNFSAFPLSGETTTALVAAINAIDNCPISGTVLGTGTGVISLSTTDEESDPYAAYYLTDSVNFVASQTDPATVLDNYSFEFKLPITSDLATGSDWINEEVFIVPLTISNLEDWFNSFATSALSELCRIERTYGNNQLQISSKTVGAQGGVQIVGGSGNSSAFSSVGASTNNGSVFTVSLSKDNTVHANQWVKITNTKKSTKNVFSNSSVVSISSNGELTTSAGPPLFSVVDSATNLAISVFQEGDFACIAATGISASEGDWVQLTQGSSSPALSAENVIFAQVVRAAADRLWIAQTQKEEVGVFANVKIISSSSLLPDDIISFNSSAMGANKGDYVVEFVGDFSSNSFANTNKAKLRKVVGTISAANNVSLTDGLNSVVVQYGPQTLYKRITGGMTTDKSVFTVDSSFGMANTGTPFGSNVEVLDKLGFPTTPNVGVDGYFVSNGLVKTASDIVYGVPSLPYSGVASVNSQIDIATPIFRGMSFSFVVTPSNESPLNVIIQNVKNAVTAFVNALPVGKPVSLSAVLSAAQQAIGVSAVSMSFPQMNSEQQEISLSNGEKPIVVNNGVTVTFKGQ